MVLVLAIVMDARMRSLNRDPTTCWTRLMECNIQSLQQTRLVPGDSGRQASGWLGGGRGPAPDAGIQGAGEAGCVGSDWKKIAQAGDVDKQKSVHYVDEQKPVYNVDELKSMHQVDEQKLVYDVNELESMHQVDEQKPIYNVEELKSVHQVDEQELVHHVDGDTSLDGKNQAIADKDDDPRSAICVGKRDETDLNYEQASTHCVAIPKNAQATEDEETSSFWDIKRASIWVQERDPLVSKIRTFSTGGNEVLEKTIEGTSTVNSGGDELIDVITEPVVCSDETRTAVCCSGNTNTVSRDDEENVTVCRDDSSSWMFHNSNLEMRENDLRLLMCCGDAKRGMYGDDANIESYGDEKQIISRDHDTHIVSCSDGVSTEVSGRDTYAAVCGSEDINTEVLIADTKSAENVGDTKSEACGQDIIKAVSCATTHTEMCDDHTLRAVCASDGDGDIVACADKDGANSGMCVDDIDTLLPECGDIKISLCCLDDKVVCGGDINISVPFDNTHTTDWSDNVCTAAYGTDTTLFNTETRSYFSDTLLGSHIKKTEVPECLADDKLLAVNERQSVTEKVGNCCSDRAVVDKLQECRVMTIDNEQMTISNENEKNRPAATSILTHNQLGKHSRNQRLLDPQPCMSHLVEDQKGTSRGSAVVDKLIEHVVTFTGTEQVIDSCEEQEKGLRDQHPVAGDEIDQKLLKDDRVSAQVTQVNEYKELDAVAASGDKSCFNDRWREGATSFTENTRDDDLMSEYVTAGMQCPHSWTLEHSDDTSSQLDSEGLSVKIFSLPDNESYENSSFCDISMETEDSTRNLPLGDIQDVVEGKYKNEERIWNVSDADMTLSSGNITDNLKSVSRANNSGRHHSSYTFFRRNIYSLKDNVRLHKIPNSENEDRSRQDKHNEDNAAQRPLQTPTDGATIKPLTRNPMTQWMRMFDLNVESVVLSNVGFIRECGGGGDFHKTHSIDSVPLFYVDQDNGPIELYTEKRTASVRINAPVDLNCSKDTRNKLKSRDGDCREYQPPEHTNPCREDLRIDVNCPSSVTLHTGAYCQASLNVEKQDVETSTFETRNIQAFNSSGVEVDKFGINLASDGSDVREDCGENYASYCPEYDVYLTFKSQNEKTEQVNTLPVQAKSQSVSPSGLEKSKTEELGPAKTSCGEVYEQNHISSNDKELSVKTRSVVVPPSSDNLLDKTIGRHKDVSDGLTATNLDIPIGSSTLHHRLPGALSRKHPRNTDLEETVIPNLCLDDQVQRSQQIQPDFESLASTTLLEDLPNSQESLSDQTSTPAENPFLFDLSVPHETLPDLLSELPNLFTEKALSSQKNMSNEKSISDEYLQAESLPLHNISPDTSVTHDTFPDQVPSSQEEISNKVLMAHTNLKAELPKPLITFSCESLPFQATLQDKVFRSQKTSPDEIINKSLSEESLLSCNSLPDKVLPTLETTLIESLTEHNRVARVNSCPYKGESWPNEFDSLPIEQDPWPNEVESCSYEEAPRIMDLCQSETFKTGNGRWRGALHDPASEGQQARRERLDINGGLHDRDGLMAGTEPVSPEGWINNKGQRVSERQCNVKRQCGLDRKMSIQEQLSNEEEMTRKEHGSTESQWSASASSLCDQAHVPDCDHCMDLDLPGCDFYKHSVNELRQDISGHDKLTVNVTQDVSDFDNQKFNTTRDVIIGDFDNQIFNETRDVMDIDNQTFNTTRDIISEHEHNSKAISDASMSQSLELRDRLTTTTSKLYVSKCQDLRGYDEIPASQTTPRQAAATPSIHHRNLVCQNWDISTQEGILHSSFSLPPTNTEYEVPPGVHLESTYLECNLHDWRRNQLRQERSQPKGKTGQTGQTAKARVEPLIRNPITQWKRLFDRNVESVALSSVGNSTECRGGGDNLKTHPNNGHAFLSPERDTDWISSSAIGAAVTLCSSAPLHTNSSKDIVVNRCEDTRKGDHIYRSDKDPLHPAINLSGMLCEETDSATNLDCMENDFLHEKSKKSIISSDVISWDITLDYSGGSQATSTLLAGEQDEENVTTGSPDSDHLNAITLAQALKEHNLDSLTSRAISQIAESKTTQDSGLLNIISEAISKQHATCTKQKNLRGEILPLHSFFPDKVSSLQSNIPEKVLALPEDVPEEMLFPHSPVTDELFNLEKIPQEKISNQSMHNSREASVSQGTPTEKLKSSCQTLQNWPSMPAPILVEEATATSDIQTEELLNLQTLDEVPKLPKTLTGDLRPQNKSPSDDVLKIPNTFLARSSCACELHLGENNAPPENGSEVSDPHEILAERSSPRLTDPNISSPDKSMPELSAPHLNFPKEILTPNKNSPEISTSVKSLTKEESTTHTNFLEQWSPPYKPLLEHISLTCKSLLEVPSEYKTLPDENSSLREKSPNYNSRIINFKSETIISKNPNTTPLGSRKEAGSSTSTTLCGTDEQSYHGLKSDTITNSCSDDPVEVTPFLGHQELDHKTYFFDLQTGNTKTLPISQFDNQTIRTVVSEPSQEGTIISEAWTHLRTENCIGRRQNSESANKFVVKQLTRNPMTQWSRLFDKNIESVVASSVENQVGGGGGDIQETYFNNYKVSHSFDGRKGLTIRDRPREAEVFNASVPLKAPCSQDPMFIKGHGDGRWLNFTDAVCTSDTEIQDTISTHHQDLSVVKSASPENLSEKILPTQDKALTFSQFSNEVLFLKPAYHDYVVKSRELQNRLTESTTKSHTEDIDACVIASMGKSHGQEFEYCIISSQSKPHSQELDDLSPAITNKPHLQELNNPIPSNTTKLHHQELEDLTPASTTKPQLQTCNDLIPTSPTKLHCQERHYLINASKTKPQPPEINEFIADSITHPLSLECEVQIPATTTKAIYEEFDSRITDKSTKPHFREPLEQTITRTTEPFFQEPLEFISSSKTRPKCQDLEYNQVDITVTNHHPECTFQMDSTPVRHKNDIVCHPKNISVDDPNLNTDPENSARDKASEPSVNHTIGQYGIAQKHQSTSHSNHDLVSRNKLEEMQCSHHKLDHLYSEESTKTSKSGISFANQIIESSLQGDHFCSHINSEAITDVDCDPILYDHLIKSEQTGVGDSRSANQKSGPGCETSEWTDYKKHTEPDMKTTDLTAESQSDTAKRCPDMLKLSSELDIEKRSPVDWSGTDQIGEIQHKSNDTDEAFQTIHAVGIVTEMTDLATESKETKSTSRKTQTNANSVSLRRTHRINPFDSDDCSGNEENSTPISEFEESDISPSQRRLEVLDELVLEEESKQSGWSYFEHLIGRLFQTFSNRQDHHHDSKLTQHSREKKQRSSRRSRCDKSSSRGQKWASRQVPNQTGLLEPLIGDEQDELQTNVTTSFTNVTESSSKSLNIIDDENFGSSPKEHFSEKLSPKECKPLTDAGIQKKPCGRLLKCEERQGLESKHLVHGSTRSDAHELGRRAREQQISIGSAESHICKILTPTSESSASANSFERLESLKENNPGAATPQRLSTSLLSRFLTILGYNINETRAPPNPTVLEGQGTFIPEKSSSYKSGCQPNSNPTKYTPETTQIVEGLKAKDRSQQDQSSRKTATTLLALASQAKQELEKTNFGNQAEETESLTMKHAEQVLSNHVEKTPEPKDVHVLQYYQEPHSSANEDDPQEPEDQTIPEFYQEPTQPDSVETLDGKQRDDLDGLCPVPDKSSGEDEMPDGEDAGLLEQSSLECLLEMLAQRGTVVRAFIADEEGQILAQTNNCEVQTSDVKCLLCCVSSSYTSLVRMTIFSDVYTCFTHQQHSAVIGRSERHVFTARRVMQCVVVGFSDSQATENSCFKEVMEISQILSKRRL